MKIKNVLNQIIIVVCIVIILGSLAGCFFLRYYAKTKEIIANYEKASLAMIKIDEPGAEENPYGFMPKEIAVYIVNACESISLDPDIAISFLVTENPAFNPKAIHVNENGTCDVGLFQANDRYLYSVFLPSYWKFTDVDFDAFNWRHNAYVMLRHIKYLLKAFENMDDAIMAYNCGAGAVMNGKIPESTRNYLIKTKNTYIMLKEIKKESV